MKKVGGLCFDERTRRWKACAQTPATSSTGGERRCCVNEKCCIDCDDLRAIQACAASNIQLYFQTVEGGLPNVVDASQLVRQWKNQSHRPGGCNKYVPQANLAPTALLQNGEEVPCYAIEGYVNDGATITPGNPVPVGIVFEANDKENCKDFAIFFLLDVYPFGAEYRWELLGHKYCINYQRIRTKDDFLLSCQRCPAVETCQLLVKDEMDGGLGVNIEISAGIIPLTTEIYNVTWISLIVPECCVESIPDFTVERLGSFTGVTTNFDTPPSGPGVYGVVVTLQTPTEPGPGQTVIRLRTNRCGTVTVTIRYTIVS